MLCVLSEEGVSALRVALAVIWVMAFINSHYIGLTTGDGFDSWLVMAAGWAFIVSMAPGPSKKP